MTTKIQTAFTGTWQPNNVESFSAKLQKFNPSLAVLRAWQEECATSLINSGKNNRMVVAPTGSGKSIAINYLISHMLHNNMAKKLIVSVPQKAIGGGYAGGVGPNNLVTELPRICVAANCQPHWIDMKGKLHTHTR